MKSTDNSNEKSFTVCQIYYRPKTFYVTSQQNYYNMKKWKDKKYLSHFFQEEITQKLIL